jgi:hypothetical protein
MTKTGLGAVTIVILLLLAISALATPTASEMTDGGAWRELDGPRQLSWLSGFNEGLAVGVTAPRITAAPSTDLNWPHQLNFGEVIQSLNGFYSAPENRPIPVWSALAILSYRMAGASPSQVDSQVARARRDALKPQ